MKSAISLCFFLVLGFLARCYNHALVFVAGKVYFVDGDCYSRMTRVKMILAHPFSVIHHQYFENYPQGIASHATAPFDYLIAFLSVLIKPFNPNYLDLAGAFVSPLLGLAMILFLWDWSRRLNLPYREIMLLLISISPIVVHGTVLGRPDHQSLQMLCIMVALGAEWSFSQKPSRGWGIASGAAWGLGLWVSLYEPLVLLVVTVLLYLAFDRKKLWMPERRVGYAVFAGIIVLMLLIDGLPFSTPDNTLLEYFPRWEKNIGELKSVGIFNPLLYGWVGISLIAAPVLLFLRFREEKRALALMVMLFVVWGLTLWQIRWGYFFGIVFAMSLPFQFAVFRKWWIVWGVFLLSLWPVYKQYDALLHPSDKTAMMQYQQTHDMLALRVVAEYLKSDETLPVLAPWWYCPQIAYWSGQPTVGGSSHESMPGIVDTSRFYITTDYEEAFKIVQERGVKRVIAYDPDRILQTSSTLLERKVDDEKSLAALLYHGPHAAPPFLKYDTGNQEFKVFKVVPMESVQ